MKWQLRSKSFSEDSEPNLSFIEADSVRPMDGGGLAFLDAGGYIVCLIQKDSWVDVVRVP